MKATRQLSKTSLAGKVLSRLSGSGLPLLQLMFFSGIEVGQRNVAQRRKKERERERRVGAAKDAATSLDPPVGVGPSVRLAVYSPLTLGSHRTPIDPAAAAAAAAPHSRSRSACCQH